jgi:hypothetical protein
MPPLIIGVGGTGKATLLVYKQMANLLGDNAESLVFDMPYGEEPIDFELAAEGVSPQRFLTLIPAGLPLNAALILDDILGIKDTIDKNEREIKEEVAQVFFKPEQRRTRIIDGMNCEPVVGATLAARKLVNEKDQHYRTLKDEVAKSDDVILVGSITGGTGSGAIPALASWLSNRGKAVYGVLYLPWLDFGSTTEAGGANNMTVRRNSAAVLNYLQDQDRATNPNSALGYIFDYYLVLGPTTAAGAADGLPPISSDRARRDLHPLFLVGATYLLEFETFKKKRPAGARGPHLVQLDRGLRPEQIECQGTNLRAAVKRSRLRMRALQSIAAQLPDQALSYATVFPPLLAPPALTESIRNLTDKYGGRRQIHRAWVGVRETLYRQAAAEKDRVEALANLSKQDPNRVVFDFNWTAIFNEADGQVDATYQRIKDRFEPFDPASGRSQEAAIEELSRAIIQQVRNAVDEQVRE